MYVLCVYHSRHGPSIPRLSSPNTEAHRHYVVGSLGSSPSETYLPSHRTREHHRLPLVLTGDPFDQDVRAKRS